MSEKGMERFRTQLYADSLNLLFNNPRRATYLWCFFSGTYWALLVLLPGLQNELNTYQYYLWFLGEIGVFSVYYCTRADYPADSRKGKPMIALTCVLMSVDWTGHALASLYFNTLSIYESLIMFGHCISILWASLFFYNRAIQNGRTIAWLSLLLQWVDIVFCSVSVLILHSEEGNCWNTAICIGYFVVSVLNLFLWFFPIMFGFNNTEKHVHIHMVILDLLTDLPLLVILVLFEGYKIHLWIFVDMVFKLVMLVRSLFYHMIINLIVRRKKMTQLQRQQTQQIQLQNKLWEEGATREEIEVQRMELVKQQSRERGAK